MYPARLRRAYTSLYRRWKSYSKVAEITHRSISTCFRIINNKTQQTGRPRGRPSVITRRMETRVKKHVSGCITNGHLVSACQVKDALNIQASLSTVQRLLVRLGFPYQKIAKKLPLTRSHKRARVDACRQWINSQFDFSEVVFTDERRFSCDGPDNSMSHVDTRGRETVAPYRRKRQAGGGSIMVCGALTSDGTLYLRTIVGKYKSANYLKDLKSHIIPWLDA